MDKKNVRPNYLSIYLSILPSRKKNEILSFTTAWIDLDCIMLNEINQTKTLHIFADM